MTSMIEPPAAIFKTDLPEFVNRGKVRDLYKLGGRMMIVATDRISAFDVVMGRPVPGKGVLLTQMSRFWLETLPACTPHHLDYVVSDEQYAEPAAPPCPDEPADQQHQRAKIRMVPLAGVEAHEGTG